MICHKNKYIFIHIPRTGGSSIEHTLYGQDWWLVDRKSKHLIASTAKKVYSEYWDDYFKFAFVRNPWDRMRSMLKHGRFYGCGLENGIININTYIKKKIITFLLLIFCFFHCIYIDRNVVCFLEFVNAS